jgi:hypothetical protein
MKVTLSVVGLDFWMSGLAMDHLQNKVKAIEIMPTDKGSVGNLLYLSQYGWNRILNKEFWRKTLCLVLGCVLFLMGEVSSPPW